MTRKRAKWLAMGSGMVALGMVALLPEFGVGGAAPQSQAQPHMESQGVLLGLEDPAA